MHFRVIAGLAPKSRFGESRGNLKRHCGTFSTVLLPLVSILWMTQKLGSGKGGMNGRSEATGEIELNTYNMFIAIRSEIEILHWKV